MRTVTTSPTSSGLPAPTDEQSPVVAQAIDRWYGVPTGEMSSEDLTLLAAYRQRR